MDNLGQKREKPNMSKYVFLMLSLALALLTWMEK